MPSKRYPEDIEQGALFRWAQLATHRLPELETLYAIPNGGKRGKVEAARMKGLGVKAGVSDVCLPIPRGGYGSLWIEMKAPGQKAKTTPGQKLWIKLMFNFGNYAVVCDSWYEASKWIEAYLAGKIKKP